MDWTVFMILGFITFLAYAPIVAPIGREGSGVTLGKPVVTVAEENGHQRVNGIEGATKADDSKLLQRSFPDSLDGNDYTDDWGDIDSQDNNVYSYNSANKEDAEHEDALSPSTLEEKLYGQLENQDAKNYGFHVEKDASGRDIFVGPLNQVNANDNDTFVSQNKDIKSSNASVPERLTPLGKENTSKNGSQPLEQQILNDPLAKVSYLFKQQANQHTALHNSPVEVKAAPNNSDTSANIEQNSKANHNDVTITDVNPTYENGPVGNVGSSLLPNMKAVTPISDKMGNSSQLNLHPSESNQKALNQSPSSGGGLKISVQGSANNQLPELVESVLNHLGAQGSKFVSMQLAKHPTVKNVWANAIAMALIRQSDKISQLDYGMMSKNSSKITSPERDSTGIKSTNHLLKAKVNPELIRMPTHGIADSSRGLNHTKEPTRAMEIMNKTSTPSAHETSMTEHKLNNNTPVSIVHGAANIWSQNVQDNGNAKPGTQFEINKKPLNQAANKDYANGIIDGANNNRPLFVSKNVQRLKEDHQIKASKQQVLDNRPLATPIVNGFVSNNENNNRLGESTNEEQRLGVSQFLTPSENRYTSNKESTKPLGANQEVKVSEEQTLNSKPTTGSVSNKFSSGAYLSREMDAPFFFNNITKLDPDERKYLQLNLMGDPMAKEQFPDSAEYASPQQLQEEDEKEASYFEHQINDAGQIVGEVLPGLNASVSQVDNGEASYAAGQFLDDRFAKSELAESFARDNKLINEEAMQNAKLRASILNEDSNKAFISDQHRDTQHQQYPHSVTTEADKNRGTTSKSSSLSFNILSSDKDETKMGPELDRLEDQMLLSPKTVSDISAVDLAPVRNLVRLDSLSNTNKPKSPFLYAIQSEGNDQNELMNEGNAANLMTPYVAYPLPESVAQVQKKQQINIQQKHSLKHKKVQYRRKANVKYSSTFPARFKHVKKASSHDVAAFKPTKSRNQPGIRESEISPSSVIFGLTANEMKELEKHMAHESHTLDDARKPGSFKDVSPESVAFYDVKTVEGKETPEGSAGYLIDKTIEHTRYNTKRNPPSKHEKARHTRKQVKPSRYPFHRRSTVLNNKKTNHRINSRRDLESWEAHTDVLNSDLDQIRGLSPKAQEDISKVIMKDYDGQQKKVKGFESFPFDEQDPSYAYERSLKDQKLLESKDASGSKNSERHNNGQRRLDIRKKRHKIGSHFNEGKMGEPIIMKGNKILNGDQIPLDDVAHLDAQGLILETLRKESEGDLKYANTVQRNDVKRVKSMLESAGGETAIKRHMHTQRHRSQKAFHSKASKFAEKRDLGNSVFSLDFEKQLSHALMQESKHDLTYVGAVQDMDDHGLNKPTHHPEKQTDSRTILQNQLTSDSQKDSGNNDSSENSQEKLKLFFQNSLRNDDGNEEQEEVDGNEQQTTPDFKEGVFRDLTPEGNVLSSDYKELGNFNSDDQNQLASVLRNVNSGDQGDLKELEKIDNDDEKDVESLFRPSPGTIKRSVKERRIIENGGTIETIADVADPGAKEKGKDSIVSDDISNETSLVWSAWSKCSKSCGNGSMKTRSRYCSENSPSDTFIKCPGWNHQTVPCDVPKNCPINGGFTHWTEWSACSETCGPKAVRMRMRLCTKPPPAYGGKDCSGWRFEVEYCKSEECAKKSDKATEMTKKVDSELDTSKMNKQIIFRTLSATPVIEELAKSLPSTSTETSSSARSLSRFSGLANIQQEMGDMRTLLNMQQQGNLQQFTNSPGWFQQQPDIHQFAGSPTGLNYFTGSLAGQDMPFLSNPGMGSMPQRQQETYENGGKTIHLQEDNTNIGFTPWSEWTRCSESCGTGVRTRTRSCIGSYNVLGVDRSCLGPKVQTRRCRIQRCPVDGHFTPWSDWSECSKSCGSDSYRKRERTCTDPPPRYGGEDCEGRSVQKQHCQESPCPPKLNFYNMSKVFFQVVNSKNASSNSTDGFTEWGPWSQCSRTCGSNLLRVRKRSCFNPSKQNCTGSTSEVKPCILPKCPDDPGSSQDSGLNRTNSPHIPVKNEFDWSPWSACSKTCGAGSYRKREKTCSFSLMDADRKLCIGTNIQKMPCNVPLCSRQAAGRPNNILQQGSVMTKIFPHSPTNSSNSLLQSLSIAASLTPQTSKPPAVPLNLSTPAFNASTVPSNSSYSDWSVWSKCSATCGPKAVMYRERNCKLKTGCQGLNIQTKPCQFIKCPVDGGFTGWTAWSACTKTCNTHTVSVRERYCTNPPPQSKGKDCVGQRMQARPCASQKCPVDGGVSEWSTWSVCRRCGKGKRKRTRKCNAPPPANGGKPCAEPLIQEKKCPVKHCKSTRGFGPWSSFSRCSHSCDGGITKRRRKCRKPSLGCYGPRVQRKRCNEHNCPDDNFLVRKDPVELCGYHPCKVSKCVTSPTAMCVSDSKCKPVFFNTNGGIIPSCKGDAVVLSVPPEKVCRFNPCEKSACFTNEAERCVVSYSCKPIFFGADGERAYCKGILSVPPTSVCGFDPCFEKACKVDLTAHCVTDAQCRPTFITKTQRILEDCVEDSDDDEWKDESEEESDYPDVEDISEKDNDGDNDNDDDHNDDHDDDNDNNEDDDDDDNHGHRHKKRKMNRYRQEEEKDDDDDDNDDDEEAVSKHDVPRIQEARNPDDNNNNDDKNAIQRNEDNSDSKKNMAPVVKLNENLFHSGMVSGTGSEISFVSKRGPAKFYWVKPGTKGSGKSSQLLVIEAKGSRKSSVLSPPSKSRLKPNVKSKIQPKGNKTTHQLKEERP